MTPYQVFRICQGTMGRKYRGTIDDFKALDCAAYYFTLSTFLEDKIGKNDNNQRQFISVCGTAFGSRFDPFLLMTDEYWNEYQKWADIHKDADSYKSHIKKSIQYVYDFCVEKQIPTVGEYVNRWSVSHITSGVLDEMVAYIIKVHESHLTRPEKRMIKKKFLDKIGEIEDRLNREPELRKMIEKNITILERKITAN